MSLTVMLKLVNAGCSSQGKWKAWTFEDKTKANACPQGKAKAGTEDKTKAKACPQAKATKFVLEAPEAKAWL